MGIINFIKYKISKEIFKYKIKSDLDYRDIDMKFLIDMLQNHNQFLSYCKEKLIEYHEQKELYCSSNRVDILKGYTNMVTSCYVNFISDCAEVERLLRNYENRINKYRLAVKYKISTARLSKELLSEQLELFDIELNRYKNEFQNKNYDLIIKERKMDLRLKNLEEDFEE